MSKMLRPLIIRCAFSQASTTEDGRKMAPDMCRRAVLATYKEQIEKCHINNHDDCPIKRFCPMVEEETALVKVA